MAWQIACEDSVFRVSHDGILVVSTLFSISFFDFPPANLNFHCRELFFVMNTSKMTNWYRFLDQRSQKTDFVSVKKFAQITIRLLGGQPASAG